MKRTLLLGIGILASTGVHAQSSVTLYGVIDEGIRYATNAGTNGGHAITLQQGALSGSRWGLRGAEDLGEGLQALFVLEAGFDPTNGQSLQSSTAGYGQAASTTGRLFGRQVYVGMSSKYGTVTAGRQTTVGYDHENIFDPLGFGNLSETVFYTNYLGSRTDSTLKYQGTFGPVSAEATYAFGGTPGAFDDNSAAGVSARYQGGPVTLGALYQRATSADGTEARRTFELSGIYALAPVKLYAGWLNNSFARSSQRDNLYYGGARYQLNPAWQFLIGTYYDHQASPNAHRWTNSGIVEYSLSKRTMVYGEVDYSKTSDKFNTMFNGFDSRFGATVGIRHLF